MYRIFLMLYIAFTFVACRSTRTAVEVVERTQHDTVYRERMATDSVRVDHSLFVDRLRDTIVLRDSVRMVRYRTQHDSVYVMRVDTVPRVMEVETVKEVPRGRTWFDWTGYVCVFIVLNYVGIRIWNIKTGSINLHQKSV